MQVLDYLHFGSAPKCHKVNASIGVCRLLPSVHAGGEDLPRAQVDLHTAVVNQHPHLQHTAHVRSANAIGLGTRIYRAYFMVLD